MYLLTREQLLADLHQAYFDARRHKRQKPYQLRFSPGQLRSSLNSFLGLLSHYKSYGIRLTLFGSLGHTYRCGYFLKGMRKFVITDDGSL